MLHKGPEWKKLLYFSEPKKIIAHIARAIHPGANPEERIRPILHHYNPTGGSRFVQGQTTKEVYPIKHSHVNVVVIDSGWESKAAKVLDDLADEGRVLSWLKNAFLDFKIPYTDKSGADRDYVPDFIVRARTGAGETINLILEVTGMTTRQGREEMGGRTPLASRRQRHPRQARLAALGLHGNRRRHPRRPQLAAGEVGIPRRRG